MSPPRFVLLLHRRCPTVTPIATVNKFAGYMAPDGASAIFGPTVRLCRRIGTGFTDFFFGFFGFFHFFSSVGTTPPCCVIDCIKTNIVLIYIIPILCKIVNFFARQINTKRILHFLSKNVL